MTDNKYIAYLNENYIKIQAGASLPASNFTIYEVIRVRDGKPQFLEQHIERLKNSWKMSEFSNLNFPVSDKIVKIFEQVVKKNQISNHNIRIDIDNKNLYIRPNITSYPSEHLYLEGVDTVTYKYTRNNPNAKINNSELTSKASQMRNDLNVFELILVDEKNQITEGSRSNVFFIKDNSVYTAPQSMVLGGITKMMVEQTSPYNVIEKIIKIEDLDKYDACFLTGTSIDLLPIKKIDNLNYDSARNKIYKDMLASYLTFDKYTL